jgi:hypothetical protein
MTSHALLESTATMRRDPRGGASRSLIDSGFQRRDTFRTQLEMGMEMELPVSKSYDTESHSQAWRGGDRRIPMGPVASAIPLRLRDVEDLILRGQEV